MLNGIEVKQILQGVKVSSSNEEIVRLASISLAYIEQLEKQNDELFNQLMQPDEPVRQQYYGFVEDIDWKDELDINGNSTGIIKYVIKTTKHRIAISLIEKRTPYVRLRTRANLTDFVGKEVEGFIFKDAMGRACINNMTQHEAFDKSTVEKMIVRFTDNTELVIELTDPVEPVWQRKGTMRLSIDRKLVFEGK
ncbi:MAG: hypothetical protein NC218_01865 [Acetobacter sp.]|nr:hypothetical protein [Acetobacter sp.]